MSSSTFTVLRCDRCDHEHTIDPDKPATAPAGWGKIKAIQINGAATIGNGDGGDDICPGCLNALFAWFAEPRSPVDQPTPPAPPPKPRLTALMRKAIIGRADELMRDQVAASLDVVREEPTSILSGDIVPGMFAGVGDRAAELAAAVARIVEGRS